jgi:hypothetical protein
VLYTKFNTYSIVYVNVKKEFIYQSKIKKKELKNPKKEKLHVQNSRD